MNASAIRLFQIAAYTWLGLYAFAMALLGDAAWTNAPVPLFSSHHRLAIFLGRRIDLFTDGYGVHLCLLVLAIAVVLIRRHRWWLGVIAWLLFRIITHRTWLASNGGIQLMENMLLWSALMVAPRDSSRPSTFSLQRSTLAFWIARLQLLVAYAAAAAHKFTGTTWLDGSAVLRVASDPFFHLGWLRDFPGLCAALAYLTLAWMTAFPLAVWWKWPRRVVLIAGVLFHLCTAVFMDIPQMGLAFIACYALWLDEGEVEYLKRRCRWQRG